MRNKKKSEKCNACGNILESYLPEVRDPLTGDLFTVCKCTRCGLVHTLPQPEDLRRYYEEQYYGNRHSFTLRYCIKRRLGFISAALRLKTGRRLLDIGCGDGSFLLAVRDAGWKVTGTELNPMPALSAGLDVKESIDQIGETDHFDCITMWHTLEHMRDIPSVLANIARVLKHDGKVIIAVPDFGGLQAKVFKEKWLHIDVPRHLYHFDSGSLQYCLNQAGFTIERRWHQELEYDLLGWSQSALNCILSQPNVFFNILTGKQSSAGFFTKFAGFILGSLLTVLSLPALLAGTVMGRGGSLIVVAGRKGTK